MDYVGGDRLKTSGGSSGANADSPEERRPVGFARKVPENLDFIHLPTVTRAEGSSAGWVPETARRGGRNRLPRPGKR